MHSFQQLLKFLDLLVELAIASIKPSEASLYCYILYDNYCLVSQSFYSLASNWHYLLFEFAEYLGSIIPYSMPKKQSSELDGGNLTLYIVNVTTFNVNYFI